jgi:transposase
LYLGVGIHKAFCQTTVMDESRTIVERAKVPTDREHLSEFFRRYSGSRAVIESNTVWEFVYDELRSLRIDTILANPLQVRAIAKSKKKTDRVDSATLAHLLRANLIPEAWAGPKATRDLRKDVRARQGLRSLSTSLKDRIYAEYIRTGVPYAEGSLGSKKGRERAVECLGTDPRVSTQLELLGAIEEKIQEFNRELLLPKFEENPKAQLPATIPGVGFYTALTVVAFVGDVDRFPDSSTLVSYVGLAPPIHQSASVTRLGPITQAGPHQLRWVLQEALQMHARHCPARETCQLCKFYRRLVRRRGKHVAMTAAAAKLLRVMYWMLKMNQPYRPQGMEPRGYSEGEPR